MSHEQTLPKAIALACEAHAGQTDKADAPYILHPLRVMLAQTSYEAMVVAVLHDVIEDHPDKYALSHFGGIFELSTGRRSCILSVPHSTVDALLSVTRRAGEEYEEFIRRCAENPIGRLVKLADLYDNSDMSRIPCPAPEDYERTAKYIKAMAYLAAK